MNTNDSRLPSPIHTRSTGGSTAFSSLLSDPRRGDGADFALTNNVNSADSDLGVSSQGDSHYEERSATHSKDNNKKHGQGGTRGPAKSKSLISKALKNLRGKEAADCDSDDLVTADAEECSRVDGLPRLTLKGVKEELQSEEGIARLIEHFEKCARETEDEDSGASGMSASTIAVAAIAGLALFRAHLP